MREIKFRAWTGERMEYDFLLYSYSNEVYLSDENEQLEVKPWTLMQYTGLKDKNGVEIYEGDVVRIDDTNWGYGGEYDKLNDSYLYKEISFEDGCFCLKDGLELYNYKDCEVIGNIYDHGHLLGKK